MTICEQVNIHCKTQTNTKTHIDDMCFRQRCRFVFIMTMIRGGGGERYISVNIILYLLREELKVIWSFGKRGQTSFERIHICLISIWKHIMYAYSYMKIIHLKCALIVSVEYAFLCLYFDSMLILCNIIKLEHFIHFSYFDKYHNFIYYMINLMVQRQFIWPTCNHVASTPYYL